MVSPHHITPHHTTPCVSLELICASVLVSQMLNLISPSLSRLLLRKQLQVLLPLLLLPRPFSLSHPGYFCSLRRWYARDGNIAFSASFAYVHSHTVRTYILSLTPLLVAPLLVGSCNNIQHTHTLTRARVQVHPFVRGVRLLFASPLVNLGLQIPRACVNST